MRWLLIALLVSLGVLLLAAAGMARHIWLQRRAPGSAESPEIPAPAEKSDLKPEL